MIKNLLSVIASNGLNIIVSLITIIFLPKYLTVYEYSLWQLYLFYLIYIGIFHLGWLDGLYLKFGGMDFKDLSAALLKKQSFVLFGMQLFFFCLLFTFGYTYDNNSKLLIIVSVSFTMVIVNMRQFYLTLLQTSNRVIDYSKILLLDRCLFVILLLGIILNLIPRNLTSIIIADISCKLLGLIYSVYLCRFIYQKASNVESHISIWNDIVDSIKTGVPLLLANYASILILGIFRWLIEFNWGIETFGKISLILSISNLLLAFLSALAIIQYPILRKIPTARLTLCYTHTRRLLSNCFIISLLLYFPIYYFLTIWLPDYADSLQYLALLFPICILEGRVSILTNVYLKVIRQERAILKANILTIIISLILAIWSIFYIKNMTVVMYCILFVMFFKACISDFLLSKTIKISHIRPMVSETIFIVLFIIASNNLPLAYAFGITLCSTSLYTIITLKKLSASIFFLQKNLNFKYH